MNTTATTGATQTAAQIRAGLAMLEETLAQIRPEPIGEWMRSVGLPPETHVAVLPSKLRAQFAGPVPDYVFFSPVARHTYFLQRSRNRA